MQDVHSPLLCLRPSASHPQGVHGTDLPWPAQLQKRLSLPSPPPQPFTTGTCRLCEVPHFSFQLCVKGLEARCNHTVGGQQCAALNIPNSPSPEAGAGRRAPVTPVLGPREQGCTADRPDRTQCATCHASFLSPRSLRCASRTGPRGAVPSRAPAHASDMYTSREETSST